MMLNKFKNSDSYDFNSVVYSYFMPNSMDPSGLLPCTCKCDAGQADVTADINKIFQDTINAGLSNLQVPQSFNYAVANTLENSLIGNAPGNLTTQIEQKVEAAINNGTIKGKKCRGSASVIKVCGQCIGTDKLGHFVEEGLAYYEISITPGLSSDYATAWGNWTEGLTPPNYNDPAISNWLNNSSVSMNFAGNQMTLQNNTLFGSLADWLGVNLDPNGSASPADLAANAAGMNFWNQINQFNFGSGNFNFNICNFVTPSWDQSVNPNIPGGHRGSPLPVPTSTP